MLLIIWVSLIVFKYCWNCNFVMLLQHRDALTALLKYYSHCSIWVTQRYTSWISWMKINEFYSGSILGYLLLIKQIIILHTSGRSTCSKYSLLYYIFIPIVIASHQPLMCYHRLADKELLVVAWIQMLHFRVNTTKLRLNLLEIDFQICITGAMKNKWMVKMQLYAMQNTNIPTLSITWVDTRNADHLHIGYEINKMNKGNANITEQFCHTQSTVID